MSETNADQAREGLIARLAPLKARLARQGKKAPHRARADAPTLDRLQEAFQLSRFEADVLTLCAGLEIDGEVAGLCAAALGDPQRGQPTFGLLLANFEGGHWSAIAPGGALRRWRLIEVGAGPIVTQAPLRIDERILHYLLGFGAFDERLASLLTPLGDAEAPLAPSHQAVADEIARLWLDAEPGARTALVQLNGVSADCRPIIAAAAAKLGLHAASLGAERLPGEASDLENFERLWAREGALSGFGALLVESDDAALKEDDAGRSPAPLNAFLERAAGFVALREREPRRLPGRTAISFDVNHPTRVEQIALWRAQLGESADMADVGEAVAQFSLPGAAIASIAGEVRAQARRAPSNPPALWELCRRRMRGALDGLAQRIETKLGWDDLVLPAGQKRTLRAIAAQLRQRGKVYDQWGFGAVSRRGQGLSALFYGPSGAGKTMAAEVLAAELRLDLYHIDLSRLMSKYIGQTEANLRKVFDAAEDNGAILLFDEADTVFGLRAEVKDSHDRFANIQTGYLLQRMEAYRGLAILTTNQRAALDPAFMRRLRFSVAFPFPDAPERAEIWRRAFPAAAQTEGLDAAKLAHLRLAGGNIRNIALNAAFIAADVGEPVGMAHVRAAAESEYAKLERRLTQAEAEAWA
jgi:AAA+ superfamily predicted ATPase